LDREVIVADEGVLDPWVVEWLETNPLPGDDFSEEFLALARGSYDLPVAREIAHVRDDVVAGVPVRIYEHTEPATGLVVYFHGGGWCVGSISLMDNVARELAFATGAAVISVEYRLAPEHPFPSGLDDCEAVTRWALANAATFAVPATSVMVAGESAGGNLATAVALRLRDADVEPHLAGQVLVYPVVDGHGSDHASRSEFAHLVVSAKASEWFWASYTGGRTISDDPLVAPLHAESLADLPPALVVLGGCDSLRDEGRAYAERLRAEGVDAEDLCYPGQPHGFVNFGFPSAADAFETIGGWVRRQLSVAESPGPRRR
jgi:acetyl esterase